MATIGELRNVLDGRLLSGDMLDDVTEQPLGRVVIDSRQVEPGDIFWALRGPNHNGESFVHEAFRRGAAGAVVANLSTVPEFHWAVRVADTQKALWAWAAWQRMHCTGTVIAVTGSAGKTTTREMIHTVLQSRLHGMASPRNYNNHIGVPLSMLDIQPRHDYAVFELGASRTGEISALAKLVSPKLGVITRVGDAHLAGFGSREKIAAAKAELLETLPPDGHAVLGDDWWLRNAAKSCKARITWVGDSAECDLRAHNIRSEDGMLAFQVEDCEFAAPVWGRHHLTSILCAVAVGRMFGLDLDQIARALYHFKAMPMRCQVQDVHGATIVNDAYNSNPTAMEAALDLLREMRAAGRRIVVCGDMGELGDNATRIHHELGQKVVSLGRAEILIACGQFARHVVDGARAAGMSTGRSMICDSVDDALPLAEKIVLPGDVVLVKGSRMMGMERVVETLENSPRRKVA